MPLPWPGKRLLAVLALLLASCRTSQPPTLEVCILDGFGGGDCVETDGSQLYRAPSLMKNYWSTNEGDMANFSSWCYDADRSFIRRGMGEIKKEILLKPVPKQEDPQ